MLRLDEDLRKIDSDDTDKQNYQSRKKPNRYDQRCPAINALLIEKSLIYDGNGIEQRGEKDETTGVKY